MLGRGQALHAALEASAEALAKRPGVALACLFTVEGEGAFFELAAARGAGPLPCAVGARLPIGTGRHGRAVSERRQIETRGDDPPVLLACPLALGGDLNGLLTLSSAEPLPSELVAQLDALAPLLGQAIARARVEQALQDAEARLAALARQIPAEPELAQEAVRGSQRRKEQERRHAEGVLHGAQKMESLGVLAGGIAHDFNNLLVAILGHADLAARELPRGSPLATRIEQIAVAATRAAELTSQMLVYAGKGKLIAQAIDLSGLVDEISRLLGAALSKKTRVEFQLADDLPRIEGDAGQLRQVAMNLLTNASEAFEGREGVVSIRTGSVDADRTALSGMLLGEELPEGRYAFIEVEDRGAGMEPETLSRIFDPFFTTKFAGRGLGLAATLGIVRSHRGAIRVDSEKGRGTLFRVLLPVPEHPVAELAKAELAPNRQFGGAGKVLALDDEAGVLAVVKAMLGEAGFSVLSARSAPDGLEILRTDAGQEIVLAVVDLSVAEAQPGLPEALRALRPGLPILLSSSYVEAEAKSRVPPGAIDSFIQKPYRYAALVEAARRALEARA